MTLNCSITFNCRTRHFLELNCGEPYKPHQGLRSLIAYFTERRRAMNKTIDAYLNFISKPSFRIPRTLEAARYGNQCKCTDKY